MSSEPIYYNKQLNAQLKTVKPEWDGNTYIDGRYYNETVVTTAPIWSVLKWKLSRNPQWKEKKEDKFQLTTVSDCNFDCEKDIIVWLGHSSFYISINGVRILTDPCFYDLPTSKRKVKVPYDLSSISRLDYMLISHDHRDHFQERAVKEVISYNSNLTALVPLGASSLLDKQLERSKIQEAGWFQEYNLSEKSNVRIVFLPAKHWGRRGMFDYNKVLWGSFLIIYGDRKIFFAGDSAYDKEMYNEIKSLFGDIDICIMPIGAYAPQWLMSQEHMSPEEAYEAFIDLGGSIFIPMHYGTYDLTDEPLGEPLQRTLQCFSKNNKLNQLRILSVGECYANF